MLVTLGPPYLGCLTTFNTLIHCNMFRSRRKCPGNARWRRICSINLRPNLKNMRRRRQRKRELPAVLEMATRGRRESSLNMSKRSHLNIKESKSLNIQFPLWFDIFRFPWIPFFVDATSWKFWGTWQTDGTDGTPRTWVFPRVGLSFPMSKTAGALVMMGQPHLWLESSHHIPLLVGGLVAIFYCPIYWVANHPNWLSYFSEGLKPPTRLAHLAYSWEGLDTVAMDSALDPNLADTWWSQAAFMHIHTCK